MILTGVVLTDYGVYRGRNEIDLSCTADRPVVLIGGLNGAGKTTLFEAVRLCLYGAGGAPTGAGALGGAGRRSGGGGGGKGGREAYEEMLSRRVHRNGRGEAGGGRTSVSVAFRFFHAGREEEYSVTRSWRAAPAGEGGVDERLEVGRRGPGGGGFAPLDDVERPHWQEFIEGIIPRGIMQLFFFDGEKVARMAGGEEGGDGGGGASGEAIRESFGALLGLEQVEQLRADLEVNLARNLTGGGAALRGEFERTKAEKAESGRSTEQLRERLAQKMTEIDAVHAQTEAVEAKISGLGGGFAARREEARAGLAAARAEHEAACQRLRDMCAGALPFSLVPARLVRLREGILEDQEAQRRRAGREMLRAGLGRAASMLDAGRFRTGAGLDAGGAERAARLVESVAGEVLDGGEEDAAEPPMGLSQSQAAGLLRTIDEANSPSTIEGLAEHAGAAASSAERIAGLESSLARAPRDDEIGPLVSEAGRLREKKGRLGEEAAHIEQQIASGVALRHHLDSKLRDIVSRIYKSEGSERGVELTRRVQGVLEEYADRLRARKVRVLERHLLDSAHALLHKRGLIGGVAVDPSTFAVSLTRPGGADLPRGDLSEGEKQMLATALLWALARTSGRALPFMIDTPLARLDRSHRDSIVERFLPAASHQVIVLSTDEEVNERRLARLAPHLGRTYIVECDGDGAARCREGYFEDHYGEERAAAAV